MDLIDLGARAISPIGLSPFQIALDIYGRDEIDSLVAKVGDGKAPNDRGPECRVIVATLAPLGFRADLFNEFLCHVAEGMLDKRQTLLMPIFLLVKNLVRPL
ncbi:hypothetical protein D3C87_1520760 [compost metagenome]